jgi:hypothetical protein
LKKEPPVTNVLKGKREEGADHVKRPVSEIDHPEHTENQTQAGRNDEQKHALAQAVDEHEYEVLRCHDVLPKGKS